VEISIDVFSGMRQACARAGAPEPVLLVFGSLDEDPDCAEAVRKAVADHGIAEAVVFLNGVPISSHRDHDGTWHLDEIDLLRVARATHGAVLFTPSRSDVETVGLGPALAAVAGIPCGISEYRAFEENFGADFARVDVDRSMPEKAGAELVAWMTALHDGAAWAKDRRRENRRLVADRFPEGPWAGFLANMAGALSPTERT
jgi:hypothetical protein